MTTETRKTNCHYCGYLCAFDATVEDGRVIDFTPDATRYPYDASVSARCPRWRLNLEKLYDEDFLKYWSNAVFLFRTDTNKLLRASDVEEGGKHEDFVVWDGETGAPLCWCSDENRYYTPTEATVVDAQLYGTYTLSLIHI